MLVFIGVTGLQVSPYRGMSSLTFRKIKGRNISLGFHFSASLNFSLYIFSFLRDHTVLSVWADSSILHQTSPADLGSCLEKLLPVRKSL